MSTYNTMDPYHAEVKKKVKYILKIDILWNSTQKLVFMKGEYRGFGFQNDAQVSRCPDGLFVYVVYWPPVKGKRFT